MSGSPDTVERERTGDVPHRPVVTARGAALAASALLAVALFAVAALLPVPYVREGPGPTSNTIGEIDGKPLITIDGRETFPTAGHLELLTVSVSGGPGSRLDLLRALQGWIDPEVAIVPEEQVYPPGKTGEQIEAENAEQMTGSQQNATAAALRALDIPVTDVIVVQAVVAGSAAQGVLRAGDIIREVDGRAIATRQDVVDAVSSRSPGDTVEVAVTRDGEERSETITTRADPQDATRAVIGITPDNSYSFPFTVDFAIDRVGGPSAGQMFALGIIDKLTPGELNAGKYVAGTGTIDEAGAIGAIGGIQQKMVAAHDRGADLFLAPAGNCAQVVGAVPDGLTVTPVATLDDSLAALTALRENRLADLPSCPAS